jgi:RhtB (resistance to homoserine/threonine) family protein
MELDARLVAFVLLSALLIATPGPDTALIVRNALAAGPRASTFSAVGVALGILAWAGAATFGVGVILERSSIAFTTLKLAGAAYLCYLGVRSLLFSAGEKKSGPRPDSGRDRMADRAAFAQGLLSNLLNPKTGAFFITVMPQFLSRGDSPLRLVVMIAAFEIMLLLWLTAYGHVVSRAGHSRLGDRFRKAMARVSGVVLIGLGARLAFERR